MNPKRFRKSDALKGSRKQGKNNRFNRDLNQWHALTFNTAK